MINIKCIEVLFQSLHTFCETRERGDFGEMIFDDGGEGKTFSCSFDWEIMLLDDGSDVDIDGILSADTFLSA